MAEQATTQQTTVAEPDAATVAAAQAAEAATTEPQAKAAPTETGDLSPEIQAILDKGAKERARLLRSLQGLQAERDDLRQRLEERATPTSEVLEEQHAAERARQAGPVARAAQAEPDASADLAYGLPEAEDGTVLYKGSYVTKELARDLIATEQRLAQLEADEQERRDQERVNEFRRRGQAVLDHTVATIDEMVLKRFPGIPTERVAALKRAAQLEADEAMIGLVEGTGDLSQLTDEAVVAACKRGLDFAVSIAGTFAEAQAADNAAYAAKHPVKPTSAAGVAAPKRAAQMRQPEREEAAMAAARRAEEATRQNK